MFPSKRGKKYLKTKVNKMGKEASGVTDLWHLLKSGRGAAEVPPVLAFSEKTAARGGLSGRFGVTPP